MTSLTAMHEEYKSMSVFEYLHDALTRYGREYPESNYKQRQGIKAVFNRLSTDKINAYIKFFLKPNADSNDPLFNDINSRLAPDNLTDEASEHIRTTIQTFEQEFRAPHIRAIQVHPRDYFKQDYWESLTSLLDHANEHKQSILELLFRESKSARYQIKGTFKNIEEQNKYSQRALILLQRYGFSATMSNRIIAYITSFITSSNAYEFMHSDSVMHTENRAIQLLRDYHTTQDDLINEQLISSDEHK